MQRLYEDGFLARTERSMATQENQMNTPPPGPQAESSFPAVTRQERPRWVLWWLGITVSPLLCLVVPHLYPFSWVPLFWCLLTFLWLVSLTGLWKVRRIAMRVDAEGVHELFAGGKTHTLTWDEIDRIDRTGTSAVARWNLFPKDRRQYSIGFNSQLENAHTLAALIHARLHDLPLLPPSELPAPTPEEIEQALKKPPPVQLRNIPFLLRWGMVALPALGIWMLIFFGFLVGGSSWFQLGLSLGVPLLCLFWLNSVVWKIEVDEERIRARYLLHGSDSLPWQEVVGRDGATLRGAYGDLSLEGGPPARKRLLELVDQLLERRNQMAGMKITEQPSEAALMMVHPEDAADPSPATLTEVSQDQTEARLTGRELEAPVESTPLHDD